MAYDDIIIGAGLSGLATAMGLDPARRILVLTEGSDVRVRRYSETSNVPCAANGMGGLGNFWHGVIPTLARAPFARNSHSSFEALFAIFYPEVPLDGRHGTESLFVPQRPIRPGLWWSRLLRDRPDKIALAPLSAIRFSRSGNEIEVETAGEKFRAARLWICAGALDTPALLARSVEGDFGFTGSASDHVVAYLGQVARRDARDWQPIRVDRHAAGYWLSARPETTPDMLVTARPARFSYRELDKGIEQRAAFGLPVGSAIAKVARAGSLGLVSEALFNKFGLFPWASVQSLYGQAHIAHAYDLDLATGRLEARENAIRSQLDTARQRVSIPDLKKSKRPELYIRAIHLHNTVERTKLEATGVVGAGSPVRIQDASTLDQIGGEHHSFHMMTNAYDAARRA